MSTEDGEHATGDRVEELDVISLVNRNSRKALASFLTLEASHTTRGTFDTSAG